MLRWSHRFRRSKIQTKSKKFLVLIFSCASALHLNSYSQNLPVVDSLPRSIEFYDEDSIFNQGTTDSSSDTKSRHKGPPLLLPAVLMVGRAAIRAAPRIKDSYEIWLRNTKSKSAINHLNRDCYKIYDAYKAIEKEFSNMGGGCKNLCIPHSRSAKTVCTKHYADEIREKTKKIDRIVSLRKIALLCAKTRVVKKRSGDDWEVPGHEQQIREQISARKNCVEEFIRADHFLSTPTRAPIKKLR